MMICHTRHDHIKTAVLKGRIVAGAVQYLHVGAFLSCLFKHLFFHIYSMTADTASLRKAVKYRSSSAAHFKNCHSVRQLHILVHKGIELFRELSLVAVIIFLCFFVEFEIFFLAHGMSSLTNSLLYDIIYSIPNTLFCNNTNTFYPIIQ